MKQLERILFAQGGQCFFCKKRLGKDEAGVEHLVALANGGRNDEDNCVVCCKQLNSLLGSKSIKGKLLVVLNQRGGFACPADAKSTTLQTAPTPATMAAPPVPMQRAPHAITKQKAVAKKVPSFVFTLAVTKPKPEPSKANPPSKRTSDVHRRLRDRAARRGQSLEAEVRGILQSAVCPPVPVKLGSLLAEVGRQAQLNHEEFAVFERLRSQPQTQ